MKIVITEKQEYMLLKRMVNEAIGFGFSLGYLNTLPSFAAKVKYCKQFLGFPVGNGSSRMCFQLDDERILKLAKNEKGVAQNEEEGKYDYVKDSYSCFPHVYKELSDMDNFTYIVSEYVLPAKKTDIKQCFGVDEYTFYKFIETCGKHSGRFRNRFMTYGSLDDETFEQLIENYETLSNLYDYIGNYEVPVGDMLRLANWGLVNRNGEMTMVLLDSGLSQEIFNNFYRRR